MRHSEVDGSPPLNGAIYRELFRSLTAESGRTGSAAARDLPRPLARSLVHFTSLLSIAAHLRSNRDLADQLSGSVADWFASLWREFERSELQREDRIAPLPPEESLSPEALTRSLSVIEPVRPSYQDRWARLRRRIDRIPTQPSVERDRSLRAIRAEIAALYEQATQADSELRQERALRQVVTPLADHLNETIPDLTGLAGEVHRQFRTPVSWNFFDTTWRALDVSIVRRALAVYDGDAGLQRLSDLIVNGSPPTDYDRSAAGRDRDVGGARQAPPHNHGAQPPPVTHGRSPATAVPGEIGLLASEDTAMLFEQRYIDGRLISYDPRPHTAAPHPRRPAVVEREPSPGRRRAPVILCVDTSGSMKGLPERVAAAFALGVIRNALSRRRPFRVLAFQNGLRELAWSPAEESPTDRGDLQSLAAPLRIPEDLLFDCTEMLQTELEGGTDTTPVLERALEIVDSVATGPGAMDASDVVVISDITTPKITPTHLNRLYTLQRSRRLRFHALTINRNPMSDPLNVFDHRWHYRAVDPPNRGVDIDAIRGVYLTP